jgi:pilus assembly protein CpaE
VSRTRAAAEQIGQKIAGCPEFFVKTRVMENGSDDPLHGVKMTPDLLLLHYGPGQPELHYLAQNPNQVPLIVCGPVNSPEAMRLSMQAGARDYLPEQVSENDLVASVQRIQEETARTSTTANGKLVVVINGKGGSGGSFLATNLAHSLVVDAEKRTTLIDLDLQFGGLCRYLDLNPKMGILEALEVVREMDEISADAYTTPHSSGLRLLSAQSTRLVLPGELNFDDLEALLGIYLTTNEFLVADAPNRLDAVSEFFLKRADNVIVVVQQSLPCVQDAARLLQLLTKEILVSPKRIAVVVNRFDKKSPIEIGDVQQALHQDRLITVPNQYKIAAESINSGIPAADISRNAAIVKGIRKIQTALVDGKSATTPTFLQRALPGILGR